MYALGLVGMFRVLWVSLYPVVVCYGVFAGGAGWGGMSCRWVIFG